MRYYIYLFLATLLFTNCRNNIENTISNADSPYLSVKDSAYFVGKEACGSCHTDKLETFNHTGMGMSLDKAIPSKSAGDFSHALVYDTIQDLYYTPYWNDSKLFIKEFRLKNQDTVHSYTQKIDYIIGSGQHTNSHLYLSNNYLYQAPLTYYTQSKKWDLPPGFEKGANSRFGRVIEQECMACHNSYPSMEIGSANKYTNIPQGIDCERCHGAGSIHVAQKKQGIMVDTSKYIDYSIVNPGKLSIDLQFDICQRCHLQGNTILQPDKSFLDFQPGTPLKNTMNVFLPRYKDDKEHFIMASHADRLKQSACFIASSKKANTSALRPYKEALTCVTCHNPHVSVKNTSKEHFNNQCKNCHTAPNQKKCSEQESKKIVAQDNCTSCHMPVSGSTDIPHVTIHDHYIRKKPQSINATAVREFVGLYCVNNPDVDSKTRAKAYLNQYEKIEPNHTYLLDSAVTYLSLYTIEEVLIPTIQLYYLQKNYTAITNLVEKYEKEITTKEFYATYLYKKSYTNEHAWTAYRIGEAYQALNSFPKAIAYYELAHQLAPYHFEFTNKLSTAYITTKQIDKAIKLLDYLIVENPNYAPAWNNRGYLYTLQNKWIEADTYCTNATHLDPNYANAWLNRVNIYYQLQNEQKLREIMPNALRYNPTNSNLLQINSLLNK